MAIQYGVDIAARRTDDLDKAMLAEVAASVARGHLPWVLDIGCGAGAQAVRLASAGASVMAIDIADYQASVLARAAAAGVTSRVSWIQADVRDLAQVLSADTIITHVSLQRVLHYLPFAAAETVLSMLAGIVKEKMYLSITGVTSAIAEHHPAIALGIRNRFAVLAPVGQKLFSITAPLCPYHESEVVALLEGSGWKVEQLRTSDFGNIKVVAVPADY